MKQFESFVLDAGNECLWRKASPIALAPKPFAVLRYLVENPGRLITHDELLDALWPKTYVQPQVLRTYMLELRKALGDDAGSPRFIQTIPKRGFRFVATVVDCQAAGTESAASPRLGAGMTPGVLQEHRTQGIVGRDDEMTHLRAIAAQIEGGSRQVVFVTGEVGIGKTALVDFFSDWIAGGGRAAVARGQCVEGFGAKEEYYPVMEVLRHLCAGGHGADACRILGTLAPAWLGVNGTGAGGDHAGTGEPEQPGGAARMPGDLCGALERLSTEQPLILVFEDLHWADESTLHLISALARRRARAQLMIVATCRPLDRGGRGRELPLKTIQQDLKMRRLCSEIALAPLSKSAMRELVSRELNQNGAQPDAPRPEAPRPDGPPPGLTGFVHQHSEGNPLFAIALLEHLIAQGVLVRSGDAPRVWKQCVPFEELEALAPDGLARMIELEMERLSPEEQCLLEAGSLMEVAFPAWAVAAALGKDAEETEEACDGLARKLYFLERAGQDELPDGSRSTFYVFSHGLFREVLYRRQATARRANRHLRVAERLGELFHGREVMVARDLAIHYEAAGKWQRAVETLRRAAEDALRRNACAEASDLLERALRIVRQQGEAMGGPGLGAKARTTAEEIRVELERASPAGSGRAERGQQTSTEV